VIHHLELSCPDYDNFVLFIHFEGSANVFPFYLVLLHSAFSKDRHTGFKEQFKFSLNSHKTSNMRTGTCESFTSP